jgi:hypothetical protein
LAIATSQNWESKFDGFSIEGCCWQPISFAWLNTFAGLAYQGKDIVFRFIIDYSS